MIRLLGSRAVLAEVSFSFAPSMRAQKDAFRPASALVFGLGAGGFSVPTVSALYEARPRAFNPPEGFCPAFRCHAGVFAMFVLVGSVFR